MCVGREWRRPRTQRKGSGSGERGTVDAQGETLVQTLANNPGLWRVFSFKSSLSCTAGTFSSQILVIGQKWKWWVKDGHLRRGLGRDEVWEELSASERGTHRRHRAPWRCCLKQPAQSLALPSG